MMKAKHLSGSGFWWRGEFANVIRRPSRRPFSNTVRGVQTLLKELKSFQLVWPKKILPHDNRMFEAQFFTA